MSGRDAGARGRRHHREVQELLPWYVNDTLAAGERTAVEDHLGGCAACREEVERCRELAAAVRSAGEVAPAPHPVQLARLLGRIEAAEAGRRRSLWRRTARGLGRLAAAFGAAPAPLRWALAAQLAVLLAVAAWLAWGGVPAAPEAAFRTLAEPGPAAAAGSAPQIRVVFSEEATEREIRQLLLAVRAEIVGGPSPLGAYTLRLPAADAAGDPLAVVVEHLRGHPRVRFAEPVRSGPGPPP